MNKLLLEHLPTEDGSYRICCPFCKGGSSKEKCFVITKQGSKIYYVCHRASCGARGRYAAKRGMFTRDEIPADYNKRSSPAPPSASYYYPQWVVDETGERRGAVYRRYPHVDKSLIKSINCIEDGYSMLHFPQPLVDKAVVVVEDIPSANRLAPYYPCIALLGTNLNVEKIDLLNSLGVDHIIIALDNDATVQASRLARKFAIKTSVVVLQKDVKDMRMHELLELITRLERL